MTKFMKRLLTGLALGGLVFATPVLAGDAKVCPRGAITDVQDELKAGGVSIDPLTKEEQAAIVEQKGLPPGISDGETFQFLFLTKDGMGQVLVINGDGCITFVAPPRPAPIPLLNKFLGRKEA